MTPLEATRAWLRTCPHIDKNDKLNLNHLGAAPTGYSLTLTGHTRKEDVCGSVTSRPLCPDALGAGAGHEHRRQRIFRWAG